MSIKSFLIKERNLIYRKLIDYDTWGGQKNYLDDEGNRIMRSILEREEASSVIRMGFSELELFFEYERNIKQSSYRYDSSSAMHGTFSSHEEIEKYMGLIKNAYKTADVLVNWYSSPREEKIARLYFGGSYMASSHAVEPYYFSNPWSELLREKKVLVITPFDKEVEYQYSNRTLIWNNSVLPKFTLKTVKSVWYLGKAGKDDRFATWFDALGFLEEIIDKEDFDVALLGCGPFGVPLCDYIKQSGKTAIYIGGALQILFGIKGRRWDNHPKISTFYNQYWIRPNDMNKPNSTIVLDNNCYW